MMEKLGQAKTHLELKKMIAEVDKTNSGAVVTSNGHVMITWSTGDSNLACVSHVMIARPTVSLTLLVLVMW